MALLQDIQVLSETLFDDTVALRRYMHMHPELSYQEVETGRFIAAKLTEYGIKHEHGIAENGVVAIIEGRNPSKKVVALRADFDALPIQETNEVAYKSTRAGVMHACGHDAHTSSLLSVARLLNATRHEWEGTVKMLFQPAEEKLPGGAKIMIAEGVLENPAPSHIIGQHVLPTLEAGKVGFRSGIYMASADEIYITVRGKGGHGAMPNRGIDPVLIAAHLIVAMQQVVSRNCDPIMPSVLTFGRVIANGATNIIPDEVQMEATFRTLDETWRAEAHRIMVRMAEGLAESMGGTCQFRIERGYPCLYNDADLTERSRIAAVEYLGADNVVELPIRMTAEDFAYYSQQIPACFYRLGTGNIARGITSQLHTSTFDVEEQSLRHSPGLMAWLTIRELQS